MDSNDQKLMWLKVAASWLGGFLGWLLAEVTLGRLVLLATLTLTLMQIYITARDKLPRRRR